MSEEDQVAGDVGGEQPVPGHEPEQVDEPGDEAKPDGKGRVLEGRGRGGLGGTRGHAALAVPASADTASFCPYTPNTGWLRRFGPGSFAATGYSCV